MNKIIEVLRDGMKQKLLSHEVSSEPIPAGSGQYIALPVSFDQMLIKSVEVTANKGTAFIAQFFEQTVMANSRYNSGLVTGEAYDVMDLPYIDQDGTNTIHFYIDNRSDFDTSYRIEVRGIAMK